MSTSKNLNFVKTIKVLFVVLTMILYNSCNKHKNEVNEVNELKTTKEKIIGTWKFKVPPQPLINGWMGHYENRSVFSGQEILTFSSNNDFIIDSVKYGTWQLYNSDRNISIDMSSSEGYGVGMFEYYSLDFNIIELNDTLFKVQNDFYRFYENYYYFEPNN